MRVYVTSILIILILCSVSIAENTIFTDDGSVDIETGEITLGEKYRSMGEESLEEMFQERLIVLEMDDNGNVTKAIVDGSGKIDTVTGLINGTGNIDLWFLGSFNVSEAAGQGEMEKKSMDITKLPGARNTPGISDIKGIENRTGTLDNILENLNQ
ncbi:MAG: hypothetical protein VR65_04650 [Desulfobulbaceae bacterium BRH_c16a]|nr:MAG: hypothetical protein VR65_04650 [Desulfobulbaceae bacterium BRH_c16a]